MKKTIIIILILFVAGIGYGQTPDYVKSLDLSNVEILDAEWYFHGNAGQVRFGIGPKDIYDSTFNVIVGLKIPILINKEILKTKEIILVFRFSVHDTIWQYDEGVRIGSGVPLRRTYLKPTDTRIERLYDRLSSGWRK